MRLRLLPILFGSGLFGSILIVVPIVAPDEPAEAATISVAYAAGHRDVTINGYGTPALGTFTLRDGDQQMVALCIESDESHTTAPDAYAPTPNRVTSPELDALVWLVDDGSALDADTATAAAALAWFYADARRNIGPPVWSDGSRGFARISPTEPEPWDALARFSLSHPVGLRAGNVDIDGAERRVAELARQATALAGPWGLTADASAAGVRLTGAHGAIPGQTVQFQIAAPGTGTVTATAITDADGWARPALPGLADGAHITATVSAPGVHREWDGAPGVQRMVTATTTTVTAAFDVPAMPRYVAVHKSSADPTLGVAGAQFALIDATGATASSATTDATGVATFAAIDPALHPAPYAVRRELSAPPGLLASTSDVPVPAGSTDRDQPTIVDVVDQPARASVLIRKVLSAPAGPPDHSGFVFTVRRSDGWFDDQLATGVDGITDAALVPVGNYQVCETATPTWSAGFVDGGCVAFTVDLDDLASTDPITVDYLNVVPTTTTTPTIAPTTQPEPTTPEPTTATTTTSTTTETTTTTTIVAALPPVPTTTTIVTTTVPRSLPTTGGGAGHLLDLADLGFLAGVALIAISGLFPRRPERGTAGR